MDLDILLLCDTENGDIHFIVSFKIPHYAVGEYVGKNVSQVVGDHVGRIVVGEGEVDGYYDCDELVDGRADVGDDVGCILTDVRGISK